MYEMTAVLIIYAVLSFAGMAVLWTLAARKGIVRPPSYFFWVRTVTKPREAANLANGGPQTVSLGFAATTVFVAVTLASAQAVTNNSSGFADCPSGGQGNPNVMANVGY